MITKFKIKIIEQTFISSMFSLEICCLKILILFILQKVCDEKKCFSNRRKLNGCNPKKTLIDTFLRGHYMYVQWFKNDLFSWGNDRLICKSYVGCISQYIVTGAVKAGRFVLQLLIDKRDIVCSLLVFWSYLGRKRVCLIHMPVLLTFVI